ncbi:MAG: YbjN domain-containing protein [Pseudomonadota bacterium]
MSLTVSTESEYETDIFDVVEQVLELADWQHERDDGDAVQCVAPTRWGEMGALFAAREDPAALHFSLTLDVKPQAARRAVVSELVLMMNERLWLGHFDYWIDENVIIYRHALPLAGRSVPALGEIHAVMAAAVEAVERFVPACNFVVWAGKTPGEALAAAMFETDGEA